MAITLASGINASTERLVLSEGLTAEPGDLFRLGDEVVEFSGYDFLDVQRRLADHSHRTISVQRGRAGTVAASHTSGVALLEVVGGLVSAADSPDPFGTGGAGAPSVSLLGPFVVDFDGDPNVNSDLFLLPDSVIADGTLLLDTLLLIPVAWESDTTPGATFKLEIVPDGQTFGWGAILDTDAIINNFTYLEPDGVQLRKRLVMVDYAALADAIGGPVTSVSLGMEIYVAGGADFTAGQAAVYILVASRSA